MTRLPDTGIIKDMFGRDKHLGAPRITGRIFSLFLLLLTLQFLILPAGLTQAAPPVPGNPDTGKRTYEIWCASCHGVSGKGIGNMPSFVDANYQSERSDLKLLQIITLGVRGTGMPPFSILSETDRRNVIAYIRTLATIP